MYEEYMPTDKQYNGQLIEQYAMLKRIQARAAAEGASETLKLIDEEMLYIKLKLQPIELPDDNI